jgi:hypothetical protein
MPEGTSIAYASWRTDFAEPDNPTGSVSKKAKMHDGSSKQALVMGESLMSATADQLDNARHGAAIHEGLFALLNRLMRSTESFTVGRFVCTAK